jgi:alpha-L-fucosidase
MFAEDLAAGRTRTWSSIDPGQSSAEIDLGRPLRISTARFEEPIEQGQSVAKYTFSGWSGGEWHALSRGTTIGYARVDRFSSVEISRVRLVIEEQIDTVHPIQIRLYA